MADERQPTNEQVEASKLALVKVRQGIANCTKSEPFAYLVAGPKTDLPGHYFVFSNTDEDGNAIESWEKWNNDGVERILTTYPQKEWKLSISGSEANRLTVIRTKNEEMRINGTLPPGILHSILTTFITDGGRKEHTDPRNMISLFRLASRLTDIEDPNKLIYASLEINPLGKLLVKGIYLEA